MAVILSVVSVFGNPGVKIPYQMPMADGKLAPAINLPSPLPSQYWVVVKGSDPPFLVWTLIVGKEPIPPPPPPPPPPDQKWQVVIIYELDDRDNYSRGQQVILTSLEFRARLKKEGHRLVPGGIVDQDVIDADGAIAKELAPYFSASEGDPLPRICIAPLGGGRVLDFVLPETEQAVFDLLNRKGLYKMRVRIPCLDKICP